MTDTPQANTTDPYQRRYSDHQRRKRDILEALLLERHSERAFDDRELSSEDLAPIRTALAEAPSSCDRRGLVFHEVTHRDDKALLGGLLVGGVGWVHRAPWVLLLFGDLEAYKAPGEADFMPFLDAGVVVGQALLAATASGLAACYINPNIRDAHRAAFNEAFSPLPGRAVYCGAIAVGHPHRALSRPVALADRVFSGWDDPKLVGTPGAYPPCPGCDPGGNRSYCMNSGPGCRDWR